MVEVHDAVIFFCSGAVGSLGSFSFCLSAHSCGVSQLRATVLRTRWYLSLTGQREYCPDVWFDGSVYHCAVLVRECHDARKSVPKVQYHIPGYFSSYRSDTDSQENGDRAGDDKSVVQGCLIHYYRERCQRCCDASIP
ncbi:hypothetical protein ACLBOM_08265 [Escherichia coli]